MEKDKKYNKLGIKLKAQEDIQTDDNTGNTKLILHCQKNDIDAPLYLYDHINDKLHISCIKNDEVCFNLHLEKYKNLSLLVDLYISYNKLDCIELVRKNNKQVLLLTYEDILQREIREEFQVPFVRQDFMVEF